MSRIDSALFERKVNEDSPWVSMSKKVFSSDAFVNKLAKTLEDFTGLKCTKKIKEPTGTGCEFQMSAKIPLLLVGAVYSYDEHKVIFVARGSLLQTSTSLHSFGPKVEPDVPKE